MSINPKVLVVGANGRNGQELIKQLQISMIPVRAMVRNKHEYQILTEENIEVVEGELSQPATLENALQGIELGYIVTANHPQAVAYYKNFFDVAKQVGVKKIIKMSALGADINSSSEVLRQHAESDQLLIDSGLNYAILRPNSFYQNLLYEARNIKRRNKFRLPLANSKQSLVDIRDVAEATVNLCKSKSLENKIYNLTGAESLSYYDVAGQLSNVLDKPIKYIEITSETSQQGMKAIGLSEWNVRVLTELQIKFAKGAFSEIYDDLAKLLKKNPTKFAVFVKDYASQF